MSVEGIKISLGEVSKTAGVIRTINDSLSVRLEDIKKEINGLSSTWQSDAGNTIRNKINAMTPRFEEYKTVVDTYAKFLDATVTSYDATETTINNNANAFR